MPSLGSKRSLEALSSVFDTWKRQPSIKKMVSRPQMESLDMLWSELKDKDFEMRLDAAKLDARLEERVT